ncbi:copper-binding protein [Sphingomonas sp. AR_OL41]|uniref:copper-binding protein n=1 Tax=Sphingomonas sp. AR_OL41 TaxID=3042729 RepID=UPI0024813F78|nr:copper-binding protein [Sphingomonas sp. AR_OL41]MDH7972571.1 copper-binding protein [Sphingomonas sp. AR_OL41]
MKLPIVTTALAGTLMLAGCGSKPDTTAPTAAATTQPMGMPAGGAADQTGKIVHGVGVVTAIDTSGGKITLKHHAIPEAGWPAMTMAFTAAPPIVAKSMVGESVAFDLKLGAAGGEVIGIRPQ